MNFGKQYLPSLAAGLSAAFLAKAIHYALTEVLPTQVHNYGPFRAIFTYTMMASIAIPVLAGKAYTLWPRSPALQQHTASSSQEEHKQSLTQSPS